MKTFLDPYISYFARVDFRDLNNLFGIYQHDRLLGMYLLGKTGSGKTNVMKMEVQEVIGRGASIVNLPNKNNEVLMNFMLAPKDLSANGLIEVKARESLCKDTSKTYFTIISYEIVE